MINFQQEVEMRAEDVLEWVRAAPFVPFRIRLNSGGEFEIRHPEMIKVGRSTVHIFTYRGEPTDPFEHMQMIGLILIESIEPLEPARSK